jgi:DNA-binding transcriptional regulator YdaS (Cro superfamily)
MVCEVKGTTPSFGNDGKKQVTRQSELVQQLIKNDEQLQQQIHQAMHKKTFDQNFQKKPMMDHMDVLPNNVNNEMLDVLAKNPEASADFEKVTNGEMTASEFAQKYNIDPSKVFLTKFVTIQPEVMNSAKEFQAAPMMDHIDVKNTKVVLPRSSDYQQVAEKLLNNPQVMADFKLVQQGKMSIEEFKQKYELE